MGAAARRMPGCADRGVVRLRDLRAEGAALMRIRGGRRLGGVALTGALASGGGCCRRGVVMWLASRRPESRERWSGGLVFEGVVGKPWTSKVDPARLYGLGVRQWVRTFAKCADAEARRRRRVSCTS